MATSLHCPNCGLKNPSRSTACGGCGFGLKGDEQNREKWAKTLQPLSVTNPIDRALEALQARQVVLELVFHSDLRRIGEACVLGPAADDHELLVGRNLPFRRAEGDHPVPLSDPCVSRQQLHLRWLARRKTFQAVDACGRGGLRILDARGQVLTPSQSEFPAGSLLVISDRIVLLCTTRPLEFGVAPGLVGQSEIMADLRSRIRQMARVREALLIRGEPGTGKELVARGVHEASSRCNGPYVPVNCAAIPEALVENELFGHARGAFTGAVAAKDGLFASARGGTIFLDEIGDMPMAAQTRLLRVLQEGKIRPVGTTSEIAVDVRVIAATNRDLAADVASGRFRADLLTRLAGLEIEVPTLRARRVDVPHLFATFFLRRAAGGASSRLGRFVREADEYEPPVPLDAVRSWLAYDWPGNVRELERYAAAVDAATGDQGPIVMPPLSSASRSLVPGPLSEKAASHEATQIREPPRTRPDADALTRLFGEHDFVVQRVAQALGTTRPTVIRWAQESGIVLPQDLSHETIAAAARTTGGDLVKMAHALRVGVRGLKLRMKELGMER